MPEVTAREAARIVDSSQPTIFRRVEDGSLPARRVGIRRDIYIEIDTLRSFAEQYGYKFDEALAKQLAK